MKCDWCGKLIYRTAYRYNKHDRHFCSNKCQALKRESETYERRTCEICGRDMYVRKSLSQRFCSDECQNAWQRSRVNFENPKFEGGALKCEWCGKEFIVGKYRLEHGSKLCSNECRRAWFANVWSQSESWKDESKRRAASLLQHNSVITQTRPQVIANAILDELGITYVNEKPFVYYSVDNYLPEQNLIIEVMGDYWHCSPIRYKEPKNDKQRHIISRDKAKHTFLRDRYGIEVLYLWESDLLNDAEKCKAIISEYVGQTGRLSNYHSFNYNYDDNILKLSRKIIAPFQDGVQIAC